MKKKKILVLVDWFAPGYKAGGPIQSCVNFAYSLRGEFDIYVLTTDTDHGETAPYPDIPTGVWLDQLFPGFHVKYLQKSALKKATLKKEMEELAPDFIYLNHLFSPLFVVYPLWLHFTGKLKSRVVLCPRGALYDSALSVKKWKKTPFIALFKLLKIHKGIIFHATNEREKAAIEVYFPGSRIQIADNLPKSNQPAFQSLPKTSGELKCIFIARIVPIKNLLFFLEALEDVKIQVKFTVVGPAEDKAYWAECQQKIARLKDNIQVEYLGPRSNDQLMTILQEHHVFVLPTTGENFGHSIFEALLAGRPVLISDQTPWLNLAPQKVGWDLPLDQQAAFTRTVQTAGEWGQPEFDEWARAAWQYAHDFISNPELKLQYLQLFS